MNKDYPIDPKAPQKAPDSRTDKEARLRADLEEYRDRCEQLTFENRSLKADLEESRGHCATLKARLAGKDARLKIELDTISGLVPYKERAEELLGRLTMVNRQCEMLEERNAHLERTLTKLQAELNDLDGLHKNQANTITALLKKLQEAVDQAAAHRKTISQLQEDKKPVIPAAPHITTEEHALLMALRQLSDMYWRR